VERGRAAATALVVPRQQLRQLQADGPALRVGPQLVPDLGSSRIVVSGTEAPIILVHMVRSG
jgi:hypothetical protein